MQRHPAEANITNSLIEVLGETLELQTWQAVSGSSIHQAWHVESSTGQHFFIKTNQASKYHTLETEALGLAELGKHITQDSPLRIPKVYTSGSNATYAWLILEYIEFGRSNSDTQKALGIGLAMLHQEMSSQFGFDEDNVIGESLQTNAWSDSWLDFFAEQRLGTQFKLAKQRGFYSRIANEAERLLDVLPTLLKDHHPAPSLLHGDLWGGNAGCNNQGTPIIFDPAIYYGDRECDLAMTELFGGFSAEFYAAYNHVYPLDAGYKKRKNLYNLYHILNHANLFGGGYIMQSKSMMQQLIRDI